jgi:hypothetical protein
VIAVGAAAGEEALCVAALSLAPSIVSGTLVNIDAVSSVGSQVKPSSAVTGEGAVSVHAELRTVVGPLLALVGRDARGPVGL